MDVRVEVERRTEVTGVTSSGLYICCPFHDDENPSLGVDTRRGIFHCFSCGESGTIYKLLAKIDGVSVDEIRGQYQEEWKAQRVLEDIEDQLFDQAFEDVEGSLPHLTRRYKEESFNRAFPLLETSEEGTAYMHMRGLSDETIEMFDLRWGLAGRYAGRVIIPVYDDVGKLLSYTGRAINPSVQPKTRKPRGNKALYTLFGMYHLWLANDIKRKWETPLILVEGEIDSMYLQQMDFPAVATMGTSTLTSPQIDLIVDHGRRVLLMFDGDDAGRKATISAKAKLEKFLPVSVAELPEGKDPNDLNQRDAWKLCWSFRNER